MINLNLNNKMNGLIQVSEYNFLTEYEIFQRINEYDSQLPTAEEAENESKLDFDYAENVIEDPGKYPF